MTDEHLKTLKEFLCERTIVAVLPDDSRSSATQKVPGGALVIFDDGKQMNMPVNDVLALANFMKIIVS